MRSSPTFRTLVGAAALGGCLLAVPASPAAAAEPLPYESVDVSANAGIVAFVTTVALVPADTNGRYDAYVENLANGKVTLASATPAGKAGNAASTGVSLSPDGGWVAFESNATDLVAGDTNGHQDAFLRDLAHGTTVKVSGGKGAKAGDGDSSHPVVSKKGTFVAFASTATNLVPGDTNGQRDVFRWRRSSGATVRVSVGPSGEQGDAGSSQPTISDDGQRVGFMTLALNWGQCPTGHALQIAGFSAAVRTMPTDRLAIHPFVSCDGVESWESESDPELVSDGHSLVVSAGRSDDVHSDHFLKTLALSSDGRSLDETWTIGGSDNSFRPFTAISISGNGTYVAFQGCTPTSVPCGLARATVGTTHTDQPQLMVASDTATSSNGRMTAFVGSIAGESPWGIWLVDWTTGATTHVA